MKVILEGSENDQPVIWQLGSGHHIIGRALQSRVRLEAGSVSRVHAALSVNPTGVLLEDLGSRNGTRVNGERIGDPVALEDRDTLAFGGFELSVRIAEQDRNSDRNITALLIESGDVKIVRREYPLDNPASLRSDPPHGARAPASGLGLAGLVRATSPSGAVNEALALALNSLDAARVALFLFDEGQDAFLLEAVYPQDSLGSLLLTPRELQDVSRGAALLLAPAAAGGGTPDGAATVHPLFDQHRVMGLLYAGFRDGEILGEAGRVDLFAPVAEVIAAKLFESREVSVRTLKQDRLRREKERMQQGLATAARIQRKLLPEAFPQVAGYEFAGELWPSLEVAGDLYDLRLLDGGSIMLAIGDVCGKGIGAALLASNVMASLRILYAEEMDLAGTMQRLNAELHRSTPAEVFVTLFLARLDVIGHRCEFVNAGHNGPVLINPDGEVSYLHATSVPLGLFSDASYDVRSCSIEEGALLCGYTDGIPEAGGYGEFYGDERLLGTLRRHGESDLHQLVTIILDDVESYLEGKASGDDMTVVLVRRRHSAEVATPLEASGRAGGPSWKGPPGQRTRP